MYKSRGADGRAMATPLPARRKTSTTKTVQTFSDEKGSKNLSKKITRRSKRVENWDFRTNSSRTGSKSAYCLWARS